MNPTPSVHPPQTLADVDLHTSHVVANVTTPSHAPEWRQWLAEIGFMPGEHVAVMAKGMLGGDPLVVRVGTSTFAIRRAEAACIELVNGADSTTLATS